VRFTEAAKIRFMPCKWYSVSEFACYSYEWGKETTVEGKNEISVLSLNIG